MKKKKEKKEKEGNQLICIYKNNKKFYLNFFINIIVFHFQSNQKALYI